MAGHGGWELEHPMNTRETATPPEAADLGRNVGPAPDDEDEFDADWDDPGPDEGPEDLELSETDAYLVELFDAAVLDEEEQEWEDEAEMALLQEMGIDLDGPDAVGPSMERPPLAGVETILPDDDADGPAVGPDGWWAGLSIESADDLPRWVLPAQPGREADEALGG